MKVYGKSKGCITCQQTKMFLDMNNVEYEFIDVEQYVAARERLVDLGFAALPVIEVDGEMWSGFDPGKLSKYV